MFSKLERNKAHDDKKQYYSELQRLINQKETQKQKEVGSSEIGVLKNTHSIRKKPKNCRSYAI
jgi:hypothetical protein